ncbi:MAG: hypothetical protein WCR44_00010 [Verrucomicrobiota bacterium]
MNLPPNTTPHAAFFLATIVSLLWVTVTIAQDLPVPQNAITILKELDKIDQGAKANENNRRSAAISQIQVAANSGSAAVDLYLRSLESTKYLESHQDYVDWSRKNQELLHSLSFQNAAQLQMRYLAMALQRDEKHDAFAQIPECLAYLETLASQKSLRPAGASSSSQIQNQKTPIKTISTDKPRPEALALINQPIDKSSVVQWLQISDLLPDKDFAPSAGNYQSIMEKNIRGSLRAKNDPRIIQTWDMQIAMETATATESNSKQQADAFNQTRLPDLLFHKAQDTSAIGQPNRALGEVMVLVRNYPANPSMQDWITTARGLLTNPPVPLTAVAPATNTATPPPTPVSPMPTPSTPIVPSPGH